MLPNTKQISWVFVSYQPNFTKSFHLTSELSLHIHSHVTIAYYKHTFNKINVTIGYSHSLILLIRLMYSSLLYVCCIVLLCANAYAKEKVKEFTYGLKSCQLSINQTKRTANQIDAQSQDIAASIYLAKPHPDISTTQTL